MTRDRHWDCAFHKKKLILHRASMKAYADELEAAGFKVTYQDWKPQQTATDLLSKGEISKVYLCDPTDDVLSRRLKRSGIELEIFPSPNWLSPESWLDEVLKPGKRPFMATFYKKQRQRMDILMDGNEPEGGQWSFDEENRKKLPRGHKVPDLPEISSSSYVQEAISYVEKTFDHTVGESVGFTYPVTRQEAGEHFYRFLEERFHLFGDYEDAIHNEHRIMYHSVITPALNIGLLDPQEVVDQTLDYAKKKDIPLNSVEGFIRQVIGWREFMRAMYLQHSVQERNENFWKFSRKIPRSFYDGTTGIDPIDEVVKRVSEDAYCHHIERLMVLGNFMLLCRFDPDEVYRWFMEMFIDSYDWVMVPNVYGMSQFADGGIFTTKPYLSSSNYIRKMSNYKKGPWCETWDALFWTFIADYQEVFQANHRMSRMAWMLGRMTDEKKAEHRKIAEAFLDGLA